MPEVRLIDANELKPEMEILNAADMFLVCHIIDNAPTIEAEPVRHGRWLTNPNSGERYCNRCGWVASWANERYCSYCGARMNDKEV